MKDSVFRKIMLAIIVIGLLTTILHAIYAVYAYQHSSIVYFIAKELW